MAEASISVDQDRFSCPVCLDLLKDPSTFKEEQLKSQQRIQEKQKMVQELKQAVNTIKSLSVLYGRDDSSSITVHRHLSFDGVRNYLSDIKKQFLNKIPSYDFRYLTLDPNTAQGYLRLGEKDRTVRRSKTEKPYPRHPERINSFGQVLSKGSVCGRSHWEVERSGDGCVYISVSYKGISKIEQPRRTTFGYNNQSWSLVCSWALLSFCHDDIKTELGVPSPSRKGVYVDHCAGTLSFYSIPDTMKLLHSPHYILSASTCQVYSVGS